ncbi:MAG TPA: hypothetical protein VK981_01450 [Ramlibacter sp.]|nr:hypothetical protein [Ramlibacter sp.]
MKEQRTTSILQRVPVILAVTAASYGLQAQAQTGRPDTAASHRTTLQGKAPVPRHGLETRSESRKN